MDLLEYGRKSVIIILYSVVVVSSHDYLERKLSATRRHELKCIEFGKNPYFELDMVVEKPWRTYYTWNMDLGPRCVDMKFKMAAPMVIRRIYYDMKDYLEEQPEWGAAILLMTMGRARHEMLLFDDQGPAGQFYAVANVVRDGSYGLTRYPLKNLSDKTPTSTHVLQSMMHFGPYFGVNFNALLLRVPICLRPDMTPQRRAVPLLKFYLKLVNKGRYLVMMDCEIGVISLSTRVDDEPTREQIATVVSKLGLGSGHFACLPVKDDEGLLN